MCDMSAERNTPHFILLQYGGVGYAIQNDSRPDCRESSRTDKMKRNIRCFSAGGRFRHIGGHFSTVHRFKMTVHRF